MLATKRVRLTFWGMNGIGRTAKHGPPGALLLRNIAKNLGGNSFPHACLGGQRQCYSAHQQWRF